MVWTFLVSVLAALLQIVSVVFHPLWRLIIEPLKTGATKTDDEINIIKKILDE